MSKSAAERAFRRLVTKWRMNAVQRLATCQDYELSYFWMGSRNTCDAILEDLARERKVKRGK